MKRILWRIIALSGLFLVGSSTHADQAEDYCKSHNGEVVPYYLRDENDQRHEVAMCWLGDAAIGLWTLYNFHHPKEFFHPGLPDSSASDVEKFSDKMLHNSLGLYAINFYMANPRDPEEEEKSANSDDLAGIVLRNDIEEAQKAQEKKVETKIRNPAFEFCAQHGGHPYRIEMKRHWDAKMNARGVSVPRLSDVHKELTSRSSPVSLNSEEFKRSEQPSRTACYFNNNSVIDAWTLFYGPEDLRNQALTRVLLNLE